MKDKLLSLLKKDVFISGEQLAEHLNISRTAVWKHIKILKNMGYNIKSVKNKGYQLISRPDTPFPEEIIPNLNNKIIGRKVFYYKKINSTNTMAKQKIKKQTSEGTVVVADVQTSGRGRKNRDWYSPEGGLWFSVILYPNIPPQQGMLLTMTASVSVAQAIEDITGLKPVIKWPNDLLLNGKKACGILTELEAEIDRINHAIVGIGINVNNTLDEDFKKTATTLKKETKSKIARVKLLRSILGYLDENYTRLTSGNNNAIRKLWFSYSDIIGKKILVREGSKSIQGVVYDIDMDGYLILKTQDDLIRIVTGDTEYLSS